MATSNRDLLQKRGGANLEEAPGRGTRALQHRPVSADQLGEMLGRGTRVTVMDGQRARVFGPALVRARQAAGLTQSQLSEASGVPQSTISAWERGEIEPSPEAVFLMEDVLRLEAGDLSQLLGFVRFGMDPAISVEAVISADPRLDATARQILIQLYERLRDTGV